MAEDAYNRSGCGNLSFLASVQKNLTAAEVNSPRKCELAIFDDAIVEEVIDSLRREISMLEQRLVKTEE
jgi:hypothetical protein